MTPHDLAHPVSRRHLLAAGGTAAAATLLPATLADARSARLRHQSGKIPVNAIQTIVGAEGTVSNGVLKIDVSRDDLGTVHGPLGVTFDGSFELDGMLNFQPLGQGLAFFNGCLPVHEREVQHTVDTIMASGLTLQALHQHFIGMSPQIWFVHWRGVAAPATLARGVHAVLKSTAIKLPQTMPKKPTSPLDAKRLGKILHGEAMIGDEGVVSIDVSRTDKIVIGDVVVSPEANISTNISIKPTDKSGRTAAAAPDFSMTAAEVQPVISLMRRQGWFLGCLYNQESAEKPQLYFSHMVKKGDPYALAAEIRLGLDKTAAE